MTTAQYKAVHDFCNAVGCTVRELLTALKSNGTIESTARMADLSEYVARGDYNTMIRFLEDNLQ